MKEPKKNKNEALIAIVDDDASVCEALESLLKSLGFPTASFASGRDFLSSPHLRNVACAILDVWMPVMDGLELQRHLANSHPVPIIFITAHRDENARARALRAGAVSFLTKPFNDEVLISALQSALAGAE